MMNENSKFVEPYKPSLLHAVYRWVDGLPGPYWLFSIFFLVITGLLNLLAAWRANILPWGEINWYYAFTGFFVSYFIFANDFIFRAATTAVSEFLTTLDADDSKKRLILFEFTQLPARTSSVIFLLGVAMGAYQGNFLFATAPEMNPAFPELEVTMYALSFGFAFLFLYAVLRASILIGRLFAEKAIIDIFDQTSLYAISRYSSRLIIVIAIPTYMEFVLVPSYVQTANFFALLIVFWLILLIVFWLPLRGVNRKLVEEKRSLLKEVNLRIRTNFELLHSKMDNQEYSDIAGIREMVQSLQLEQETIKSISTWPWRTGTITGVLSAVVLPVFVSFLIEIVNRILSR